jgi:polyisoprenoid-binding protein YceI
MSGRAFAPGRLAAAAVLLLAGAASAAEPMAHPCRGRIDPRLSSARFTVDVLLPIRAEGRFTEIEGELVPRPDGQCEVHVRVRADTVAYEGPEWMAKLTRSPAFLDAEAHPEVAFDSQPFPLASLNEGGAVSGRLRLRGRERPVDFTLRPAECATPGQACDIRVSGIVSRRDFGMQAYRFTVKDAVRFEFAIRLEPAP